jgi:hypothetical protein
MEPPAWSAKAARNAIRFGIRSPSLSRAYFANRRISEATRAKASFKSAAVGA